MLNLIKNIWNDESGQGLVEYGLLIVLVVAAVVAAIVLFGPTITDMFGTLKTKIDAGLAK